MTEAKMLLSGLNGANPLGFMAAVGCSRLLSEANSETKLSWDRQTAWTPVITGFSSEDEILNALETAAVCSTGGNDPTQVLGGNITVPPHVFRDFARVAADDPKWSGFAAAFGCDALPDDEKGRIQYTKLCFITGSGHQNFLETIRLLRARTTTAHLQKALFESMSPTDRGLSMRWDPADAKEYALQWANPGPEGVQASWGAYRLAIEALPLFPAVPHRSWLKTTGFVAKDQFQWPLWQHPIGIDSVRSLVAYQIAEDITQIDPLEMKNLHAMGIREIFRSERVRIGEGANFKVSFRPATSVGANPSTRRK